MRPQINVAPTKSTEVIEYDWNEQTGVSTFTHENLRTGELSQTTAHHPLLKPEVTEETQQSYFANLVFWLKTQPQEWY